MQPFRVAQDLGAIRELDRDQRLPHRVDSETPPSE